MFFKSIILVKISGKDINKFIKKIYNHGINIYKIKIKNDLAYLTIDSISYEKIDKIRTYYNLEFINYLGYKKLLLDLYYKKSYYFFLLVGFLIVLILSRLTFKIDIVTNDSKMHDLFIEELNNYDIKKYAFLKNYDKLTEIKNSILKKHEDKLEWLEIERKGTKYIVRFEPKLKNELNETDKIYDIVAQKRGRILKLDIEDGQILKNINEYVNINDMIVSSSIKLFDNIKDIKSAKGTVYGEVWYKVNIKYPTNYYDKIETGNYFKTYSISFLNKNYLLKKSNYQNQLSDKRKIIYHSLLPISLNVETVKEIEIVDSDNYQVKALNYGLDEVKKKLADNEYIMDYYILSEKTNNNIYEIDLFISTFENIGTLKERIDMDEGNI